MSSDIGTERGVRQILTLQGWRESAEKNRSGASERQKGPIDSGHRPGKGQNDTRSVILLKEVLYQVASKRLLFLDVIANECEAIPGPDLIFKNMYLILSSRNWSHSMLGAYWVAPPDPVRVSGREGRAP